MFNIESVLESVKTDQIINISGEPIGLRGMLAIVHALQANPNPNVELTLSKANITYDRAQVLASGLKGNPNLIRLNLDDNGLGDGILAIAELLGKDSRLTELSLHSCDVFETGARQLATQLEHNSTLIELRLPFNPLIGDNGTQHLVHALRDNSTLRLLDLASTNTSDRSAAALGALFHEKSVLDALDLSCNPIGDVTAKALATRLPETRALVSLSLRKTRITNVGAVALCNALERNFSLTLLILIENEIDEAVLQKIESLLERNSTFRSTHKTCLLSLMEARSTLEAGELSEEKLTQINSDIENAEVLALDLQKQGYPPAGKLMTEVQLMKAFRQLQLGDLSGCVTIYTTLGNPQTRAAFSLALAESLIAENFSDETVLTSQEKWSLVLIMLRGFASPEAQRYQSAAYHHLISGSSAIADFQSLAERVQCDAVVSLVDLNAPPATAKKIASYEQIVLTPADLEKITKPDADLAEKFEARRQELFQKLLTAVSPENVAKRALQNLAIPPWIDSDEIKTALVTFKKAVGLSTENLNKIVRETQQVINSVASAFSEEDEKPDFEKLEEALAQYQKNCGEVAMAFASELETFVAEQKSLFSPRGPR